LSEHLGPLCAAEGQGPDVNHGSVAQGRTDFLCGFQSRQLVVRLLQQLGYQDYVALKH
jgi:hypothetical protein